MSGGAGTPAPPPGPEVTRAARMPAIDLADGLVAAWCVSLAVLALITAVLGIALESWLIRGSYVTAGLLTVLVGRWGSSPAREVGICWLIVSGGLALFVVTLHLVLARI